MNGGDTGAPRFPDYSRLGVRKHEPKLFGAKAAVVSFQVALPIAPFEESISEVPSFNDFPVAYQRLCTSSINRDTKLSC